MPAASVDAGVGGRDWWRLAGDVVRARRRMLATGSVFATVHQACETLVPIVIGLVIDRAVVTGDVAAMLRWAGILALLFAALALGGMIGYFQLERAARWMEHDVRHRVVVRTLDARGGVTTRSGDVVSLASNDAEGVGAVAWVLGLVPAAVPSLIGGGIFLLLTSVQLGLVVLLGLPVMLALVTVLSRPLSERSAAQQQAVAGATAVAADLLSGLRVLKGLGAEDAGARRYRRASRVALGARLRSAAFLGGYEGVTLAVGGAFLVVVAWVGGRLALDGEITVGQLVAAVGLAQFLVEPLRLLAEIGARAAEVRACAGRVAAYLSTPFAVEDAPSGAAAASGAAGQRPGAGTVEVADVCDDALQGLDLSVPAGEILGVVASPAAGAALLELLARRRTPRSGRIELDGQPIAELRLTDLRSRILVVPHDAVLFDGPLRDAVAHGHRGDGFDEGLAAVLAASAADEVVRSVPGGLDAPVGEGGRNLSGGQRQRVALAGALAAAPPVLVLHDPTTAVDAATEQTIAAGLSALRRCRTTILLATSPALLAVCDRVVLLVGGRVAAQGRHEDLTHVPEYREAVLR